MLLEAILTNIISVLRRIIRHSLLLQIHIHSRVITRCIDHGYRVVSLGVLVLVFGYCGRRVGKLLVFERISLGLSVVGREAATFHFEDLDIVDEVGGARTCGWIQLICALRMVGHLELLGLLHRFVFLGTLTFEVIFEIVV